MLHSLLLRAKAVLTVGGLLTGVLVSSLALAQGTLEKIRVAGPSLKGNLEGDDAVRDVFVYLPPGYSTATAERYPVVYFLHGYGVSAQFYVEQVKLPASADQAIAAGAKPSIIVLPDALSVYGGSMYSNSAATGDWETYIARDLVSYIDKHYRTIAKRESRGLSGHSMGGYGTMRIGMEHPEVFSSLYAMSACCLLNQAPAKEAVEAQITRMKAGPLTNEKGFANVLEAQAAAWAPNPQNPPFFFDWPFVNGEAQPLVQGKWIANSPLITVDQHVPALKRYQAITLDVGDKDTLAATNKQLDAALTRLGVAHGFEVYDGDHTNRVGERFLEKLLPFFSKQLRNK